MAGSSAPLIDMARIALDRKPGPTYSCNQDIYDEWYELESRRLADDTLKAYGYQVQRFLNAWGDRLVTTLTAPDVALYLDHYEQLCRFLRNGTVFNGPARDSERRCLKGMPLGGCGVACAKHEALRVITVDGHCNAVGRMYQHLVHRGVVATNPMAVAHESWRQANKRRAKQERRSRRLPTLPEVAAILNATPHPAYNLLIYICAKLGTRRKEPCMVKLSDIDLKRGFMRIPMYPHRKRQGNDILILDDELMIRLQSYLEWREEIGRKYDVSHGFLLVNRRGKRLIANKLDGAVKNYFLAAGVNKPTHTRSERITMHCFRHFNSHYLRFSNNTECPTHVYKLLRGDELSKTEETYAREHQGGASDEDLDVLRPLFLKYTPRLGKQQGIGPAPSIRLSLAVVARAGMADFETPANPDANEEQILRARAASYQRLIRALKHPTARLAVYLAATAALPVTVFHKMRMGSLEAQLQNNEVRHGSKRIYLGEAQVEAIREYCAWRGSVMETHGTTHGHFAISTAGTPMESTGLSMSVQRAAASIGCRGFTAGSGVAFLRGWYAALGYNAYQIAALTADPGVVGYPRLLNSPQVGAWALEAMRESAPPIEWVSIAGGWTRERSPLFPKPPVHAIAPGSYVPMGGAAVAQETASRHS